MNVKPWIILILIAGLLAVVFTSCFVSETAWRDRARSPDSLRQLLGLPSLAIGNLSPAARNPGLELFCTGLYDMPGGYCSYFTDGVPFIKFWFGGNVTWGDDGT